MPVLCERFSPGWCLYISLRYNSRMVQVSTSKGTNHSYPSEALIQEHNALSYWKVDHGLGQL